MAVDGPAVSGWAEQPEIGLPLSMNATVPEGVVAPLAFGATVAV